MSPYRGGRLGAPISVEGGEYPKGHSGWRGRDDDCGKVHPPITKLCRINTLRRGRGRPRASRRSTERELLLPPACSTISMGVWNGSGGPGERGGEGDSFGRQQEEKTREREGGGENTEGKEAVGE